MNSRILAFLCFLLLSCQSETKQFAPSDQKSSSIDVAKIYAEMDVLAFLKKRDFGMNRDTLTAILEYPGTPDSIYPYAQFMFGKLLYHIGHWKESIPVFEKTRDLFLRAYGESHPEVAHAYAWWAMPYFKMDRCDSIQVLSEKALQLLARYPENTDVLVRSEVYSSLGHYYKCIESFEEMKKAHQRAYEILFPHQAQYPEESAWALIHLNSANLLTQDYWAAIDLYEKALPEMERIFGPVYGEGFTPTVYNDLGYCYNAVGQYDQAILYLQKAIDKNLSHSDIENCHPGVAANFKNIANANAAIGDLARAEIQYKTALQILNRETQDATVRAGQIRIGLVKVLYLSGKMKEAATTAKAALALEKTMQREHSTLTSVPLLQWLGKIYLRAGEGAELGSYFHKARKILEAGLPGTRNTLYDYELDVALAYINVGQVEKALERLLGLYQQIETQDYRKKDQVYLQMGKCHLLMGNRPQAKHWLDRIHQTESFPLADTNTPQSVFDLDGLTDFIKVHASWHEAAFDETQNRFHLDSAIWFLETGVDYLYRQRTGLYNSSFLTQTFRPLQEQLISLYQKKKGPETRNKIFRVFEQSKAVRLLEAAKSAPSKAFADIPTSLTQEIDTWESKINFYQQQIQAIPERVDQFTPKLELAIIEWGKLKAKVKQQYPNFFKYRFEHHTISIEEVQEQLQPREVLLEYFWGNEEVMGILISPHDFQLQTLGTTAAFTRQVTDLISGIKGSVEKTAATNQEMEKYTINALSLYEQLIAPFFPLPDNGDHVLLVADGPLSSIPFGALLTERPKDLRKTYNFPYLIRQLTLHQAYSASFHFNNSAFSKKDFSYQYLGFAPYTAVDRTQAQERSTTKKLSLEGLPYSKKEVELGKEIFDGDAFINEQATRANFIKEAGKAKILHFATHAVGNDENGDLSYMLLASDENVAVSDMLYTHEICHLRLQAELVVLGACESAFGAFVPGEGIVSLAYAFSTAGATSVCATYWNLNDEASYQLLRPFFAALVRGEAKDDALRKAQLYFIENSPRTAHPYYWSVFHLYGKREALSS